jgi:hypothetical protein
VPGNDVIQVEGDKIRSVEVNYDRQAAHPTLASVLAGLCIRPTLSREYATV